MKFSTKNSEFRPAWWLPNAHCQTLWPALFRPRNKQLALERERIELPDGDFIDLDWMDRQNKDVPLVLVLHGLEGSIESHYAKGMLTALKKQGLRGVFMNFRGCSGQPNRLPRCYHSGETEDLQYIIQLILTREPNVTLFAIGYSLGGNVLLKWLGETGENNPLTSAVAVSVPFELYKAVQRMQSGFSRVYDWYLLRNLLKSVVRKFSMVQTPTSIKQPNFLKIHSLYDFDDNITAPLHGFANAVDYYTRASSRQFLGSIRTPTLIIHAKDDPLVAINAIPEFHELSSNTTFELLESGGHVGFISGRFPWRPEYWLEKRIIAHFKSKLKT